MIRLLRRKEEFKFYSSVLSESRSNLNNPARGWYRIYYFDIMDNLVFSEVIIDDSHSLVMIFMDISKLKTGSEDKKAIENLNGILEFFSSNNKDIILRFAYDRVGKAMESEPARFSHVLEHSKILVDAVNRISSNIFVVQGLQVGNWGEMHTSKFLTEDKLEQIYKEYELLAPHIYLAVRKPSQWRNLNLDFAKTGNLDNKRMGIFNDGLLGSDTDLGTYGIYSKDEVGYRAEWNTDEEIGFQQFLSKRFPIGGECILDESKEAKDYLSMIERLRKIGVTYLNEEHDRRLIEAWKENRINVSGIWNQSTVFEYLSAHLGYRFIIRKASIKQNSDKSIMVSTFVENTGFAPIYQDTCFYIELTDGIEKEVHGIEMFLNGIMPGETKEVCASFKLKNSDIAIYAQRKSDGRIIEFANDKTDKGKLYLGRLEVI